MKEFLQDLPVEIVSLSDVGITKDVAEDGKTYKENAEKKAKFYSKLSGLPAVADDGGLEIDALGRKPGVYSRRWVGGEGKDGDIVTKMLQVAKELTEDNRKARFGGVNAFALPTGEVWSEDGYVEGIIAEKPLMKLLEGFPYRSFLYLPQLKKYYHESELTPDEIRKYNHRYIAIQKLKPTIKRVLSI